MQSKAGPCDPGNGAFRPASLLRTSFEEKLNRLGVPYLRL